MCYIGLMTSTFFSTGKAAAYLGKGVKTLQKWDRDGILKPDSRTKTGRRAYTKSQLDEFLGRGHRDTPKRGSAIAEYRARRKSRI